MANSDSQIPPELACQAVFATTHWSVVVSAGDVFTDQAAVALDRLCQTYWSPLYAYVRRCGHDADGACDLTQSFFAQLIEKRRLSHAARERGRFRTFLLSAMENFLRNEHDRAQALKRVAAAKLSRWTSRKPRNTSCTGRPKASRPRSCMKNAGPRA